MCGGFNIREAQHFYHQCCTKIWMVSTLVKMCRLLILHPRTYFSGLSEHSSPSYVKKSIIAELMANKFLFITWLNNSD